MQDKAWLLAIFCALFGYLMGSVSFARVIYFLVKKTSKIDPFAEPVPHTDETFESNLVSATLINKKLGAKYGMLTALLDLLKVALPTLLIKLVFTGQPWFLLTSLFGIIGHIYPVWYRFVGGRGESSILGSLFVINWFGVFLVNATGILLGFITGSVLVVRWSSYVLMIIWYWIYFNDYRYVVYMILVNIFFWLSMRKDLSHFIYLKKTKGLKFSEEDVSEFVLMGKGLGRFLDNYSPYWLLKKRFKQ